MSNLLMPVIMGPGVGVFPGNGSLTVRNASATTMLAGETVTLDLGQTGTVGDDVTSVIPGHVGTVVGNCDSVFGNVIRPNSVANQRTGQFLILLESIASGATGKAAPTGVVPALLNYQVADFGTLGMPLAAGSASATVGLVPLSAIGSASTRGEKIVAYLMATATIASSASTNSGTPVNVWFNGMGAAFGQNAG